VSSPTFTLSKVYRAKGADVDHYDFYRLSEPGIVQDQLRESINNSKTITVIEWSNTVKNVLPVNKIAIKFSPTESDINGRNIEISYSNKYENLINMLQTNLKEVKP
jgi:tRNA threonylcarbamoyladenosine biosynthesis protein TsaE